MGDVASFILRPRLSQGVGVPQAATRYLGTCRTSKEPGGIPPPITCPNRSSWSRRDRGTWELKAPNCSLRTRKVKKRELGRGSPGPKPSLLLLFFSPPGFPVQTPQVPQSIDSTPFTRIISKYGVDTQVLGGSLLGLAGNVPPTWTPTV